MVNNPCTICGERGIPGLINGAGKCRYHYNVGQFGKEQADKFEAAQARTSKFKDKMQIQEWLQQGRSYNSIANLSRIGLVENERFTERARRMYLKLWDWSEMHLSSAAQGRIFNQRGIVAVDDRIMRCQRIINSLKG